MRHRTYLLAVAQLAVASTLSAQDRAVADTSDLCSAERFPKHFTDWKASHPAYHAAVEPTSEGRVHDAPVRKRSPVLEYPRQARRDGYEGVVLLEAVVGVDGRVVFAEVLESTVRRLTPIGVSPRNREDFLRGPSDPNISSDEAKWQFENAALGLLLRSIFEPGRVDQGPVPSLICIPIEFRIR